MITDKNGGWEGDRLHDPVGVHRHQVCDLTRRELLPEQNKNLQQRIHK